MIFRIGIGISSQNNLRRQLEIFKTTINTEPRLQRDTRC